MIAAYVRVSRDDGGDAPSASIAGQQLIIRERLRNMAAAGQIALTGDVWVGSVDNPNEGEAGGAPKQRCGTAAAGQAALADSARKGSADNPHEREAGGAPKQRRGTVSAGQIAPIGDARFRNAKGPVGEKAGEEVVFFADDGYSGLSLARPGLQRVLEGCRAGRVSCVVVRDLSRLSRNYIDLGDLVERVFPQCGVRFVSVAEGIDNAPGRVRAASCEAELSRGLISIVNNAYSLLLSRNVRASMRVRWLAGEHVQAIAPFGYVYDRGARGNLEVDPVAAGWVSAMFEMAASGTAPRDIAVALDAAGVPTPSEYALACGGPKAAFCGGCATPWNAAKVRCIVKREVYAGVLVGGSTKGVGVGRGAPRRRTDAWERVRMENAHVPIVSRALFDAAQRALARVPRGRPRKRPLPRS